MVTSNKKIKDVYYKPGYKLVSKTETALFHNKLGKHFQIGTA